MRFITHPLMQVSFIILQRKTQARAITSITVTANDYMAVGYMK